MIAMRLQILSRSTRSWSVVANHSLTIITCNNGTETVCFILSAK